MNQKWIHFVFYTTYIVLPLINDNEPHMTNCNFIMLYFQNIWINYFKPVFHNKNNTKGNKEGHQKRETMITGTFAYTWSCLPPLSTDSKVEKRKLHSHLGELNKRIILSRANSQVCVQSNPLPHQSYGHRCTLQFMLIRAISSQRKIIVTSFTIHVLQDFCYDSEGSTSKRCSYTIFIIV